MSEAQVSARVCCACNRHVSGCTKIRQQVWVMGSVMLLPMHDRWMVLQSRRGQEISKKRMVARLCSPAFALGCMKASTARMSIACASAISCQARSSLSSHPCWLLSTSSVCRMLPDGPYVEMQAPMCIRKPGCSRSAVVGRDAT